MRRSAQPAGQGGACPFLCRQWFQSDMLDTFRNATKTWIVKLLFGLLVLSFLAWGVGDVIRGGLFGRGPAVEVGGTAIPAQEVQNEFKREVDRIQPLFGGKLTADDARKLGLLDRTIEQIVTRTLIDEAGRKLGLTVGDEEVVKQIAADPTFHNELGQFDRDRLRNALGRAGLSEADLVRIERQNLVRGQMAGALSGGVGAPATLTDPLVRMQQEKRIAETILVRDDSVPAPAAPPAAELEQYYKANNQRFMAPEYRALTILLMRPADVAREVAITPEAINEAYQARMDEFHTPERRQVSQIVLADQAAADKAGQLVAAGKDLAAIAKDMGQSVVDLGLVERGDLPDELAAPVFDQGKGTLAGPVKTQLGWHVAKVVQINPERTRPLAEVKGALEAELRREQSLAKLSELATKIEDTLGGGASVEETTKKFGLPLVKIAAIDAQGRGANGKPVADIPQGEAFLDVAFHTNQGTESPLTEIGNDGYFLLRVDQVTAPQPKSFASIQDQVLAAWQGEKRHELARARAENVAEQIKRGEPAAKAAQGFGLSAATTAPFTREGAEGAKLPVPVATELFAAAQPGAVSVGAAQGGWMVARLAKVIPFDPATGTAAVTETNKRLAAAIGGDLVDQYVQALNAKIGVKVDRSQLSREE